MNKVKFVKMSLEDNIELVKWSYFEKDRIISLHDYTISLFKELRKIDDLDKDEINKRIEDVVTIYYDKNIDNINTSIDRYQSEWDKYNDKYFNALEKVLNKKFDVTDRIIYCYVGVIPIFPRNIDDYCFLISTGIVDRELLEICAHEILHFLWFEKWGELYSEISREEYDSPYLSWQYSEMVVDPILNSKEIQNIFHIKGRAYDNFYEMVYDGENVMEKLVDIYSGDRNIEDKIKMGYEYVDEVFSNMKKK